MDINLGLSAVATGTADVITATYSPAPTLVDKKILFLRTTTVNLTTTPTFNPNGLGARAIVFNGNPLKVADINGVVILQYDLANTRWELLNPKSVVDFISQDMMDAIANSASPTGANPFATMSDVGVNVPLLEVMTGALALFSPSDSTTTYIGASTPLTPNATSSNRQFQLLAGTVKSAWLYIEITTTLGSNEAVTYYLRNITTATSTLIGTLTYDVRGNSKFVSGLSITVNATDYYSVEIVNPAFGTNPTNCYTICKFVVY